MYQLRQEGGHCLTNEFVPSMLDSREEGAHLFGRHIWFYRGYTHPKIVRTTGMMAVFAFHLRTAMRS
jgi:hypothetical protein